MQTPRFGIHLLGIAALTILGGCGGNSAPDEAQVFLSDLQAMPYDQMPRGPGYQAPQPTTRAHGETAVIYVNQVVVDALASPGIDAWPEGSLIVKDAFGDTGELHRIAAMEKRDGEWFWAEWNGEGKTLFSGSPGVCTGCHEAGDDFVLAFGLP